MATIGTTGSGTIARTPQDVWDFIVDPAFLHHWVKDIEPGGTWLDGETPGVVGSRYRVDYSYGRRTNEIVFEMISRLDSRFTATMFILTGWCSTLSVIRKASPCSSRTGVEARCFSPWKRVC